MARLESIHEVRESLNNYVRRCKKTLDKEFNSVSPSCEWQAHNGDICKATGTWTTCESQNCPFIENWDI